MEASMMEFIFEGTKLIIDEDSFTEYKGELFKSSTITVKHENRSPDTGLKSGR